MLQVINFCRLHPSSWWPSLALAAVGWGRGGLGQRCQLQACGSRGACCHQAGGAAAGCLPHPTFGVSQSSAPNLGRQGVQEPGAPRCRQRVPTVPLLQDEGAGTVGYPCRGDKCLLPAGGCACLLFTAGVCRGCSRTAARLALPRP